MVINLNIVTAKAREWRSRYSLCFMGVRERRRAQGVGNRESGLGWMEKTSNGVESLEK